jgi:hypothetical protein
MFRAFAPIIGSTRLRLAEYSILSYLRLGGGVESRCTSRVYGAGAKKKKCQYITFCYIKLVSSTNFHGKDAVTQPSKASSRYFLEWTQIVLALWTARTSSSRF